MVLPRAHAWTPTQKSLIIGAAFAAIVALSTVIYKYELDYRGPDESAFHGVWARQGSQAEVLYYEFRPDGTLDVLDSDWTSTGISGKWYAGGPHVYLRFSPEVLKDERRLVVWHIVNLSRNEFRVRTWRDGGAFVFGRVHRHRTAASNQSTPFRQAQSPELAKGLRIPKAFGVADLGLVR